ncbi:MAG: DUF1800 family protein [Ideonella sp.]|nr:DUF1800 family protein [Ideonella sp.]
MVLKCRRIAAGLVWFSMAAGAANAATLSDGDARRFLAQASFGPTDSAVAEVIASGKDAWLQKQFSLRSSDYKGLHYVDPNRGVGCPAGSPDTCGRDNYTLFPVQTQFFRNAINEPDQLRQRTALALSEILVVSGQQIKLPYALANYQRIFLNHAFGNFRDVLREVTLSPAMGKFLNMANNDKPNPIKGIEPNENYAREVLQLFSIGLWQLNVDGSARLGPNGQPQPSYDQETVEGFAHAFTGWTYPPRPGATRSKFPNPTNFDAPMIAFAEHHDSASKRLLNGVTLPAGQSAAADLDAAIDNIFNHPNVGPFIGRQLIQQFVTANPSPAYVARVAAAFNNAAAAPGSGPRTTGRGDMKAVLSAILLDPEASAPTAPDRFGKLREPILQLTHLFRALGGQSDGVWLAHAGVEPGTAHLQPAVGLQLLLARLRPARRRFAGWPGLRLVQRQQCLQAQRHLLDRTQRQGRGARRDGGGRHRQQDRPRALAAAGCRSGRAGQGDRPCALRWPSEWPAAASPAESRPDPARQQAAGSRPRGAVSGRHVARIPGGELR